MTDARGPLSEETWTIQRILQWTADYFAQKEIDTPRLDAELLLADTLGYQRIQLYTHFDQPLAAEERAAFRERVKRRAQREPVAYILGRREFFSREFYVTPAVLIPRPESEHLVEAALTFLRDQALAAPRLLDIGTGSGALAITLACELPEASVVATDLSGDALQVAARNAERHGVTERIRFLQGDLFAPLDPELRFDAIVCNPPYIPEGERPLLQAEVGRFEPPLALFSGGDGLDMIRRLASGSRRHLASPGMLACELGHDQFDAAAALFTDDWQGVDSIEDLQGYRRVLCARC